MKRLLAMLLCVVLLCGCTADVQRYPWVENTQVKDSIKPLKLTLTIPQEIDELLYNSIVTLEAKLQELSGGAIGIETVNSEFIATDYANATSGLYLMNGGEMESLDERLSFIQMPFLFSDYEKLFAMLNSEQGPVRASTVTASRLDGEVIGAYYGGTMWMLSRGTFYDDVGFYSTVGARWDMAGNAGFTAIGGEQLYEGTQDDIQTAFADGLVRFCEFPPDAELPQPVIDATKLIEPTNHRFLSWWVVLKNSDGSISPEAAMLVREAFAYTIEQQNSMRLDLEAEAVARLEAGTIEVDIAENHAGTRQRARSYYRENHKELGIPDDIWRLISKLV